ncbi:gap junction protein, delta 4, 40.1kDa [Columba livia]|uniref:Gap junction protein n=1 Tax=Columba livia TaxID=8932 RepID=A0A2I0MQ51_COLLI|nr:gap junction delta-4 protein [Columba livia]XP_021145682.1 gap junction delta-4 protein [Columba livia]PKK31822.1 gap junction protein, delta 4, 40.1kDa [Columba livia]
MERWDSLGFLIVTLNYNVTIVGKIWLTLIILLRMAVVVLAGYPLYQDEQERFVCNTLQPGCSNVCYDLFSPVSHFRFWLIQTVSILLPDAAFSVYVLHKAAMYIVKMHCLVHGYKGNKGLSSPKDLKELCRSALVNQLDCSADSLIVLNFSGAYTVHLFFRTLLEAAFAAVQYFLFGFFVPERFSCYHSPCTSTVDCYISRPTEKSIMMVFIWGVSSLSFLLSLADLVCALRRMTARNQKNKLLANPHVEDECVLNLPPVQHGSSSPPQNQDCPISNSSQTTDGSCSLLSEEEEEAVLHPEVVSQQTTSTNLNSNSNKPGISGDLAVEQDSTEEPLCAGDHHGTACRRARPRLQQDFIKDTALTLRPQMKSHLGVSSSVVQSKLLGHYPSAELKNPDAQSNYSSTSCLRSKKSEWV